MSEVSTSSAPLIVTLTLDAAAQARFDELRRTYFPPERLHVGAHVTMFHALPGEREEAVAEVVAEACADMQPFEVRVAGVRFLGRGVAYMLAAMEGVALRARLAECFAEWLTAQDRAKRGLHVTVQNKVAPDVARRTEALLAGVALPCPIMATGVALWRYRGGPWEAVAEYTFRVPG